MPNEQQIVKEMNSSKIDKLNSFITYGEILMNFAIPCVGAIIENNDEILIQTRWKPNRDPVYSGTLEFPIGKLDIPYENIYDALEREIYEECGLKLKSVKHDSRTCLMRSDIKNDAVFGFKPFCCTQQLKNGHPWITFIFICEVYEGKPVSQADETKNIQWIKKSEIKKIFLESPEKLFSIELPAWKYYFENN